MYNTCVQIFKICQQLIPDTFIIITMKQYLIVSQNACIWGYLRNFLGWEILILSLYTMVQACVTLYHGTCMSQCHPPYTMVHVYACVTLHISICMCHPTSWYMHVLPYTMVHACLSVTLPTPWYMYMHVSPYTLVYACVTLHHGTCICHHTL